MTTPRLLFLYPPLWHSTVRISTTRTRRLSILPQRPKTANGQCRTFSNGTAHRQDIPKRYGKAQEPAQIELPPPESEEKSKERKAIPPNKNQDGRPHGKSTKDAPKPNLPPEKQSIGKDFKPPSSKESSPQPTTSTSTPAPETTPPTSSPQPSTSSSLSEILNPSDPSTSPSEDKPLHLQPREHVHHFDTFTLVSRLTTPPPPTAPTSPNKDPSPSNNPPPFTPSQATSLMKTLRSLLSHNLTDASSSLLHKSTLEKDSYTFRAACSEMRTSISALKRKTKDQAAARLAHSRHEVDILAQKLHQETVTLKDEMRAMLDDRRMASRMEDREREAMMQELNTMIAVKLVSGVKSEVEGLRWFLTRSAALTVVGFVLVCLIVLRGGSERKKKRESQEGVRRVNEREGAGDLRSTVPSREMGTQTEGSSNSGSASTKGTSTGEEEALYKNVEQGGNPGYVSLG